MTHRTGRLLCVALVAAVATACGGKGASPPAVTIQPAGTYKLVEFTPNRPVAVGKPVTVSFTIQQPDGKPLTAYKHGQGPHNGVHLIMVRRDLATIIHEHPPVGVDGRISETVTFTEPGPYRVVVDAYPKVGVANFQLFTSLKVKGVYKPKPLPPFGRVDVEKGFRFVLQGTPHLHAIQAAPLRFTVTDPNGKPAVFKPWFGALAHAIFFRKGSLDYFHTHVCSAGVSGCTSVLGGTHVTGTSTTPGHLTVGVLVPGPGTWRLFLQCLLGGKVVTAPFTLHVS